MNLKVGIVGLPNAGKSTLFNALRSAQGKLSGFATVANYPFTTIEPNIGVVPVPDGRLEKLADIVESDHTPDVKEISTSGVKGIRPPLVPATVQFVDIAGLVKGASVGEGLGNKFLSHIREVDLVVNVIRYFDDPSVVHVAGDVDPERDRGIIETELMLADLQTIERQSLGKTRDKKENGKRQKEGSGVKQETIEQLHQTLNSGKPASAFILPPEEQIAIRELHLLSMKPVLYVANVAEEQLSNSQIIQLSNNSILSISAKIEAELSGLSDEEQKSYLKELGLEASGLDRLIQKAYEMLGLISFLTCGVKEVRAWTIKHGTKAPQAAGVIHTDFEKKFIKADVVSFPEFIGWKQGREEGKVRSEGREYVIEDGDVVEFKIGA